MIRRSVPKRRSAPNNPNNPNQPDVGNEIEVDEEQEMMGNDAAVQRMQSTPPAGNPAGTPGSNGGGDPWAFNLFGGTYQSQIDGLAWDNGLKMSSEVDGGIRSKKKTTTDSKKLGEGPFGDVTWTNSRSVNTYKDSDIDLDVGVDAERTRSGNFDGMEYNSSNTRSVDLGGGLEHKAGDELADGRVGVSMATKHAEQGKLKQGNFDIEQSRRRGHSLDADWKDTRGRAVTGGKYTHFQDDRQTVKEKLDTGKIVRKRNESSRTKLGGEKGKTGYSFDAEHQFGGGKSMDRQFTDANGVKHADLFSGEYDAKGRFARQKNGNLKAAFDGDFEGDFSQGRTEQTVLGKEETVVSGSGALLQEFDISKTKSKGIQWSNDTDAKAEVGMSKAITSDITNGTQTNTVYGGVGGRAQVARDKDAALAQQYNLGGNLGYKHESDTSVDDKRLQRSLDTNLSLAGEREVEVDGEKKHLVETGLSTKGKSKTTTQLEDGKHARTWSGKAGVSHEMQINPNGNVHVVKADAGVDRDVRRTTNLDDGKRTNDYNVGGSVSERMRINKDGKRSHRIKSETHAGAGTKRVVNLDDGKRTNMAKGSVEASHVLKLNQSGTRTQEVKVGADAEVGTKRQRNLDDGSRTTGVVGSVGASDLVRIDNDGNKSHELRGNVGLEGMLNRQKQVENGVDNTDVSGNVGMTKVLRIDKDGNKGHELDIGMGVEADHTRDRTLSDGTLKEGIKGTFNAGDTIKRDKDGNRTHLVDVNGAIDLNRDRMRNVTDGKIDTNLKGRLEGGDKIAVAADGSKTHTINGKLSGEAGRTQTTNLDDGKRTTNIIGTALGSNTSVLNPDGTSTHNLKAEVGTSGSVKREQTLADGSRTRQVKGELGLGDELAIAADKSQTHTLTGKAKVSAENKRVLNHDDGKETITTDGSTGTRVKHVLNSGVTNFDIDSKVGHSTSRDQQLSDTVKETNTTGHTATLNNDIDLQHADGVDQDWELKHNKTKAGYIFDKGRTRRETFDDRTETIGRNHQVKLDGALAKDKQSGSVGYTLGRSSNVAMNNGSKTLAEEKLGITAGAERNVTRAEDGTASAAYKLSTGFSKETKDELTRKTDAGTYTEKTTQKDGLDLGYGTSDRVGTVGLSRANTFVRKDEQGVEYHDKNKTGLNFDTQGNRSLSRDSETIRFRQKEKLSDRLTLTTDRNTTTLGTGVSRKVNKDDGTVSYGANAKASYTALSQKVKFNEPATYDKIKGLKLGDKDTDDSAKVRTLQKSLNKLGYRLVEDGEYSQATLRAVQDFAAKKGMSVDDKGTITEDLGWAMPRVGLLGNGMKAEASYEAGKAEANAKADAVFSKDQIKIKGAAGAKITMIGGNAKIELPVHSFTLGGERLQAAVTMGVNAAVLAEVDGKIDVDLEKGNDKFNAGFSGGAEAFVGAKGGAEIGAEFKWLRQSGDSYADDFKRFARSIPGKADDWIVDQLPEEFWPQLSSVLMGRGPSRVLYAKAGVEGRAGLGASANFSGGFKDGMISFSGNMSGTVGLGGGVNTDFGIHAVDGARLGGIWSIRSINYISDHLDAVATWTEEAIDEVQKSIDEYMEEKKAAGGISGMVAGAVDFIGDDLFGWW